jgi:hypothetical protein
MAAHKIVPPPGLVPLCILHKLDPCQYVTGYRRAKAGKYGPIYYGRGGGYVDKVNVEAAIGRRVTVQEIMELMKIVRGETRVVARRRYVARKPQPQPQIIQHVHIHKSYRQQRAEDFEKILQQMRRASDEPVQ